MIVLESGRLGVRARRLIDEATLSDSLFISAITPWEIAMLAEKGRLALGFDVAAWLDATLALPGIRLAPISPATAVDSVRLPGAFHADPADRLIVASARNLGAMLLTADRGVLDYAALGHVHAEDAGQ